MSPRRSSGLGAVASGRWGPLTRAAANRRGVPFAVSAAARSRIAALAVLTCVLVVPSRGAMAAEAINVLDFGAVGDGKTDCTAAFQQALDRAGKEGDPVQVPGGHFRFAGHLRVPSGVTIVGSWQGPPAREKGSVLLVTEGAGQEGGPPFITLEGAAGIKGLVLTYPDQRLEPPPIPYPWTVRGLAQDCQVRDCLIVRPYQAVDFGTYPCSRHYINGLYGSPLRRGIYVDGSVDVGRISNVHFSTFFFPYQGPLDQWKLANAEAFIIGKADWEWMDNCFALGYHVGFRFMRGTGGNEKREGPPNYVAITRSGIDESGNTMIVEDCGGITASQCVFKGHAIQIRETNTGPIKFSQCWFSPMPGTESLVEAYGRERVSFVDCRFEFWDTLGNFAPALKAGCASLLVQGCEFGTHNRRPYFIGDRQKTQIELLPTVRSAVITGNRFRYGESVIDNSQGMVRRSDNVVDDYDAWDERE